MLSSINMDRTDGYYDETGAFNRYRNGYTDFFQILYSLGGLILFIALLLYILFCGFLIFLTRRFFEQEIRKRKYKNLMLEQRIVNDLHKTTKSKGLYLFDGTFVPKWEYDKCCVECLLLTKQLVNSETCKELQIHKPHCSPITNFKCETNATPIWSEKAIRLIDIIFQLEFLYQNKRFFMPKLFFFLFQKNSNWGCIIKKRYKSINSDIIVIYLIKETLRIASNVL